VKSAPLLDRSDRPEANVADSAAAEAALSESLTVAAQRLECYRTPWSDFGSGSRLGVSTLPVDHFIWNKVPRIDRDQYTHGYVIIVTIRICDLMLCLIFDNF
jgi:hypothetical protein